MSEHINVEHAFDPEAFQAQKDMNEYTATRPHQDEFGNARDTEGQVVNADAYFDAQREANEVTKSYEDMTTYELVTKYVDAKKYDDQTTLGDIEDEVNARAIEREDATAAHKTQRKATPGNRPVTYRSKLVEGATIEGAKTNETDDYIQGFMDQVEKREAKNAAAARNNERENGSSVDGSSNADSSQVPESGSDGSGSTESGSSKDSTDKDAVEKNEAGAFEYVATSDREEAKAFWEAELKGQGIELESYLSHEDQWLVKRPVAKKEQEVETPEPSKPTAPTEVVKTPSEENGPKKPATPVTPPRGPQGGVPTPAPEKKKGIGKKVAAWGAAVLAVVGLGGYFAGRGHENYIVKSHDTPSVDEINKMQDKTRKLPYGVQEDMARNYDQTEAFFDGLKEEKGAENFDNYETALAEAKRWFAAKYPKLPELRVEELAQKSVDARLAAQTANQAEQDATK